MSPEQQQIQKLQQEVKTLTDFMRSFENAAQVPPLVKETIQKVVGAASLNTLSDVSISNPSSGQILKYSGDQWINGTDNIGSS